MGIVKGDDVSHFRIGFCQMDGFFVRSFFQSLRR